jgi:cation diffusion facilitator family transporter
MRTDIGIAVHMAEERISLMGLAVNFALSVGKLIIGFLSQSTAIVAEGLHSGMDIFSSVISYVGIRVSKKPADTEHPYGHYKAEVVSGFVITIILLLTAVWILYESITSFLSPVQKVIVNHVSIGIMVTSAILNEVMYHVKIRSGKKYDSVGLISDGMHSRIDVLTSITVLVGVAASQYSIRTDSIAAFVVGLYILKESFSLGKRATDSLLDVSAGADVEGRIRVTAAKEKVKIKALKTQKRGPKIFAQLDVILPDNLRVDEASSITKNLEQRLVGSIENLDYVTIQIASHEIGESYYRGIFGRAFGWQRRGRIEKVEGVRALGPGGYCVCPNCGHRIKHEIGIPCSSSKCPKCNANLTREV